MPSTHPLTALVSLAAVAAASLLAPAHAAGTVEVRFVEPANFSDIGFAGTDRERHLATLEGHFQRLAGRLPDGQTLQVDVLDVDLAGEVWPHRGTDMRILRGGADWPRLTLRYQLRDADGVLKSGEQRIADPAYRFELRGAVRYGGALGYEQRLIERWFADSIEEH